MLNSTRGNNLHIDANPVIEIWAALTQKNKQYTLRLPHKHPKTSSVARFRGVGKMSVSSGLTE